MSDRSHIHYDPDQAMLTSWELWLSERPEIEPIARKLPPWNCYRQRGQPHGHYSIESYNPNGTVTLNHGRDSTLPGMQVFGVPAEQIEACGCRRWQWPTHKQAAAVRRHVELTRDINNSLAKLRAGKPN